MRDVTTDIKKMLSECKSNVMLSIMQSYGFFQFEDIEDIYQNSTILHQNFYGGFIGLCPFPSIFQRTHREVIQDETHCIPIEYSTSHQVRKILNRKNYLELDQFVFQGAFPRYLLGGKLEVILITPRRFDLVSPLAEPPKISDRFPFYISS
jgi:hypothetical protein